MKTKLLCTDDKDQNLHIKQDRRRLWSNILCRRIVLIFLSLSTFILVFNPWIGLSHGNLESQTPVKPKRVLVLCSLGHALPTYLKFIPTFISVMRSHDVSADDIYVEYLDLLKIKDQKSRQALVNMLRQKYAELDIGLIVTLHWGALDLLLKEGEHILPNATVLAWATVVSEKAHESPESQKPTRRILYSDLGLDLEGTLRCAIELFPTTKRVLFIAGTWNAERKVEQEAKAVFSNFPGNLKFEYTSDLTLEEMYSRVTNLPPDSIIVFFNLLRDKTGRNFISSEVGERVAKTANAPVFCLYDFLMGSGAVGGSMPIFSEEGIRVANLALDVLSGKIDSAQELEPTKSKQVSMFDWQQIKKWGGNPKNLPQNAMFINRSRSVWSEFGWYIGGFLAFSLCQSFLILGLVINRRLRKSAEDSLREAEKKYRNIFEGALEGIFETSPEGEILTANPALAKILGYGSPEEIVSTVKDLRLQVWVDPAEREKYIRMVEEEGVLLNHECQYYRKGGTKIWVSLNARRVAGPDGKTLYYSGFVQDINERKRAEEEIAESRAYILALVDSTKDFIWSVDPVNFGLVSWNEALKNYFLKDRGIEIRFGMTPEHLLPTEEYALQWCDIYSRALREGSFVTEYTASAETTILLLTLNLLRRNGEVFGISVFGKDITERKRAEQTLRDAHKALEEQLKFEMLLTEISTGFVSLPADLIDSEINDGLRRICECLEIDQSTLWQSVEDRTFNTMTHSYRPKGTPAFPPRLDAQKLFPWCLDQILDGKIIAVSTERLPPEASRDQETWREYGVKSCLAFPLSTGGEPIIGALAFDSMREERTWSEPFVLRLKLLAQIFANALARKHSDQLLHESEARLSLATNAAGVGLWGLDIDTGKAWVSPKNRELFHFAPEEELSFESLLSVIHPGDRELVNQALQKTIQTGENLSIDYRVVLPDESNRWRSTRGQCYPKSAGKPEHVMGVSFDITERKLMENQLQEKLREIDELKQRLEMENICLQDEINLLADHSQMVAQSLAMKKVLAQVEQVARTDSTVLILGETGTGKELVARAVYGLSSRRDRPLIAVNCASLPPTLIESELFGREKGAYTGALTRMAGRFEVADGSTLFLDEMGELPLEIQAKLLRVLEAGEFERLGSTKLLHTNVRVIAATNRNIEQEVNEGKFRKDLFYRLNVFPILIPPLRERPEDIPAMVWTFVKDFQKRMGKKIETIQKKTMDGLQTYHWPGNVRELKNVIEHGMIISKGSTLVVELPGPELSETGDHLEEIERKHLLSVLKRAGWRIGGKNGASEMLGLDRMSLYRKMKRLDIVRPGS